MATVSLCLLTFNCAKVLQSAAEFERQTQTLLDTNETNDIRQPDVLVFGLQEVAPILDSCFDDIEQYLKPIRQGIQSALTAHNVQQPSSRLDGDGRRSVVNYKLVQEHSAGSLALLIAINTSSVRLNQVSFASSRCGYLLSSLKGAVGMRLTLSDNHGTSPDSEWTLVTAHLAANEGPAMLSKRNADFQTIATSLDFDDGYALYKPGAHTFFMGDLNYRATCGRSPSTSANVSSQTLVPHDPDVSDELLQVLHNGDVYKQFEEARITFAPTYKFNLLRQQATSGEAGAQLSTVRSYNYKRVPSWCDRILYRTYHSEESFVSYLSSDLIHSSDHIPVVLRLTVPTVRNLVTIALEGETAETSLLSTESLTALYPLNPYRGVWTSVGCLSDGLIGWALYLGTTNRGRLWFGLLLTIILAWIALF
ncbi:DNase I-like protein [Nadsonia fulvescens var. elongata DSM 6958]|uniref:DNase I-like protein n=1 Tax=Nadsonia fulvescens var. elongata DSM 6958 TaxID=857566 RepID=A0A1E3PEB6_9ASCO|nr:DNase I-like protein [Nadsonia fulvescens var. elongata DSM 6958]